MGNRASVSSAKSSSSLGLEFASGGGSEAPPSEETLKIEAWIGTELPEELRGSAKALLRAVASKVAVPGHFDAFCCQAFSKPEWAAASSLLIAEIFEQDEDQLAELARIPDLIIEMGSGEVNVTCMVASRWAARGETHRLSRLADAIVASYASKSVCAVDVMLALAATLAVTRFSRAEQLYNAALPLSGEDHQEALADARRWLAAGRIVCSVVQEERDFWDVRLRKPKVAWTWKSKAERDALDHLSECLTSETEGTEFFRAVLPECWWELAMKFAQQQEKLASATAKLEASKQEQGAPARTTPEAAPTVEKTLREIPPHPQPGPLARFGLIWLCGCFATLMTLVIIPRGYVERVLDALKPVDMRATPAQLEAWRKETLKKKTAEMAEYEKQYLLARIGTWKENEEVLSGKSVELPFDSPQYMNLLICLHLDPPKDEEVRSRLGKLLLDRVKGNAISLWEYLIYPGSTNSADVKKAAKDALADTAMKWSAEEKKRLGMIAAGQMGDLVLPVEGGKK
ncbi:hypothetical protein [Prosthecobacter sp.]|uniref:hypothetical protein n=1 Tax=Prosthecobacter sp. TaxID=1965333 RepID=UPI0037846B0A